MRLLDLFSGIGGFSLAASWVWGDELEIEAFVEIDSFCQKFLRKHWPGVPIYDDIKKIQWVVADTESGEIIATKSRGLHAKSRIQVRTSRIDLLTGGFPCQPFSCAGKRAGTEDDRYLWPEMLRAIQEVKPRWIVAENVPGLLTLQNGMVFEGVCTDLEAEDYSVQPLIIPACAQGAPHRRDRVWIVAKSTSGGWGSRRPECAGQIGASALNQSDCHAPDTGSSRTEPGHRFSREPFSINGCDNWQENWYEVAQRFCVLDAGLSDNLAGRPGRNRNRVQRLKALGNSIVPQIAFTIFKAIKEIEV